MHISIVGSGYVGLVTAVGLASKGHEVVCIDTDQEKVDLVNQGRSPFYDDGFDEALCAVTGQKRLLKASRDYEETVRSQITFICVSTPVNSRRGTNLSFLEGSAKAIGEKLGKKDEYVVVVVRSTVVPGTTEEFVIPILEKYSGKKAGKDFGVATNPEFLQEGKALKDFMNPSRIVIGQYDQRSGDTVEKVYRDFNAPILRTHMKTAEMIKLASNAFLATKVSFINEIGNICKKLGIDVYEVAEGMGLDPRIGKEFLRAGIGYGGSCLPKDVEALIYRAIQLDMKPEMLGAVSRVNVAQPFKMLALTQRVLGALHGKKIAVLGLAFKPGVEDTRDSPALEIIDELLMSKALVKVYDPKAMPNTKNVLGHLVEYGASVADTIADCDCVLIVTEWDEFKDESLYKDKVVIDGRRALDPQKARQCCSHYEGICW